MQKILLNCEICGLKAEIKPEALETAEKIWYITIHFEICSLCQGTAAGQKRIALNEVFMEDLTEDRSKADVCASAFSRR